MRKRGGGGKKSPWDGFHYKPYSVGWTLSHITDLTTGHSGLVLYAGFSFFFFFHIKEL